MVRWTAPTSGSFLFQGKVVGLDHGGPTTTSYYVVLNSTRVIFSGNINTYKVPTPLRRTLAMSAGDTLDFAIDFGQNRNYNADSTGIQFNVTQTQ